FVVRYVAVVIAQLVTGNWEGLTTATMAARLVVTGFTFRVSLVCVSPERAGRFAPGPSRVLGWPRCLWGARSLGQGWPGPFGAGPFLAQYPPCVASRLRSCA